MNEKNRKWWTLGAICFSLFMILLDGSVVNLAIPKIIVDFKASLSQIEWINNGYTLAFVVALITFGRLGDEYGRKRLFMGGLVAFVLGSILCGTAQNINQLIFYRVIQGFGGAAMMPSTLSLIAANFERKERGLAMGMWGAVSGLSFILGPIIGGFITDKGLGMTINNFFHITELWRYVFFINVPVGILAFLAALFVIKESKDSKTKHTVDIFGVVLSSIALFILTYALIEGTRYGWFYKNEAFTMFGWTANFGRLSVTPIMFALSLLLGGAFVLYDNRHKSDPLVDLALFKDRNFTAGNFTGIVLSFAMMGSFFLLPIFMQSILGFSAIKTGQTLVPLALALMIGAPVAGKLSDKYGAKYIIFAGMLIMAFGGYYIGHFRVDTTVKDLILPFMVIGIGMGMAMSPLINITLFNIPEGEVGGASGVVSTMRQVGSIMGIAILGAFLQTQLAHSLDTGLNGVDGLSSTARAMIVTQAKTNAFSSGGGDFQKTLQNQIVSDMSKPNISIPANYNSLTTAQQQTIQQQVGSQIQAAQTAIIAKLQTIGMAINSQLKTSIVDGINKTFHVAALISLFGALTTLAFKNNRLISKARNELV